MLLAPFRSLKPLLNQIKPRSRIALGQVFLLVGVLMLSITLGLIPNERHAGLVGRAKFCEAVAVHCSTCVARGDLASLRQSFGPIVGRDSDVLSAAIVGNDGTRIAEYGTHPADWEAKTTPEGADSRILVPIWTNNSRWGGVQIRFRALSGGGFRSLLANPQLRLVAFVACMCTGLFFVYLRKVLQHLDPSKVVPPRVRSALDTLAEGLLVLDNEKRIVLANQAFATLVGKRPDELMGSGVAHLPWIAAPSAEGQSLSRPGTLIEYPWDEVSGDGQVRRGAVMRLRDSSGSLRTFSVNCSPVLGDEKGGTRARGVLVSLDDVTVLQQKEEELRISRDAAERANQAKSEFLARMSHEIRTPMNAILGFADVLRRGYESDQAERHEFLETIHSSGQHLLELINDVLDLSKIEAGKLEIELARCSPHKLISEVVSVLSVRARQKGIGLKFEWESPVPETIATDATRLRQVITNLVGNAIKFTDSGSVRIVARLDQDGAAPSMTLRIIDSGIGMKPEALERIFKPFSQADTSITRRFGGTGLGLSISKQIVEALGGEIQVESQYGHGSTFTVTIGVGALSGVRLWTASEIERAVAASPASAAAPDLKLPPCRVLLVEDGVSNRKFISLVLHRAGVAMIDEAEDGQSGAEKALVGSYDVVLMDMQMPVMDGYAAASLLRGRGFTTPIIALTAHAMRGDEEKCRAAGCSGFLTKPIDMDLLVRTIADAVRDSNGVASAADSREDSPGTPATARSSSEEAGPAVGPPGTRVETLQPLRSSLPTEDPEFAEIVSEFVDRLGQQLTAIRQAWERSALDDLARLAHWVKGSGGTAGFDALTAPARALETAAREGQLDAIGTTIATLQGIADRIISDAPSPMTAPLTPRKSGSIS